VNVIRYGNRSEASPITIYTTYNFFLKLRKDKGMRVKGK